MRRVAHIDLALDAEINAVSYSLTPRISKNRVSYIVVIDRVALLLAALFIGL